jgi:hypothetical protein
MDRVYNYAHGGIAFGIPTGHTGYWTWDKRADGTWDPLSEIAAGPEYQAFRDATEAADGWVSVDEMRFTTWEEYPVAYATLERAMRKGGYKGPPLKIAHWALPTNSGANSAVPKTFYFYLMLDEANAFVNSVAGRAVAALNPSYYIDYDGQSLAEWESRVDVWMPIHKEQAERIGKPIWASLSPLGTAAAVPDDIFRGMLRRMRREGVDVQIWTNPVPEYAAANAAAQVALREVYAESLARPSYPAPVLRLPLAGDLRDKSGNAGHATATGGTAITSNGATFDGVDDYLRLAGKAIPLGGFTVMMTVTPTAYDSVIFTNVNPADNNGFTLTLLADGTVQAKFELQWFFLTTTAPIPLNVPTHLAFSWVPNPGGGEGLSYLNGVRSGGSVVSDYDIATTGGPDLLLGAFFSTVTQGKYFKGTMRGFRMYPGVLTPAQIKAVAEGRDTVGTFARLNSGLTTAGGGAYRRV